MNARPERSVGGIFAARGVVTDELDSERVVVDEQLGRNIEVAFRIAAVGAAEISRSGLDGGEEVPFRMSLSWLSCGIRAGEKA